MCAAVRSKADKLVEGNWKVIARRINLRKDYDEIHLSLKRGRIDAMLYSSYGYDGYSVFAKTAGGTMAFMSSLSGVVRR